jgi:hypothetical protein
MKVVFLDIDGVLNSEASMMMHCQMVPEKVMMIRRLCEETGAKVVISSSWRGSSDINDSTNRMVWFMLSKLGLNSGFLYGVTGDHTSHRGSEIEQWLLEHDYVHSYVIIDDDSDFHDYQQKSFVNTDVQHGFTWRDYDKALEILGREE